LKDLENISFHAASTDFLLERHAVSIKEHGQILSAIESGIFKSTQIHGNASEEMHE